MYRWSDGTEYEGSWKEGSFNGIGIFRSVDGSVDYSVYKDGYATGVGALWTDGYTKAYRTLDGVKMEETSLAEVEKLAKEKFGLPAPSLKPRLGIASSLGRIFRQKRIGTDGKLEFKVRHSIQKVPYFTLFSFFACLEFNGIHQLVPMILKLF